jgi:hypothetical protein
LNNLIIFLFYFRGRNVYVQFSSHQELTTVDQSQGRGDEVCFFCSYLNWKLHVSSCWLLTKADRLILYFLFSMWYIPHISVLLWSVVLFKRVLCLKLIFYESIVILFSLSHTSLFILLSFYHILLYLFSFLSISSLSQCCPAVWNPLDAQPNRILLVTIHHVLYPITVDVLFQVFSPHGSVEKIVTFQKSAGQILSDFSLSLLSFRFMLFWTIIEWIEIIFCHAIILSDAWRHSHAHTHALPIKFGTLWHH